MDVDEKLARRLIERVMEHLIPPVREALGEMLAKVPDPEDAELLLDDRNSWVQSYAHAASILRKVAILLAKNEEGMMTPEEVVDAIREVLGDPPSILPPSGPEE